MTPPSVHIPFQLFPPTSSDSPSPSPSPPPATSTSFTVSPPASAPTDIWRKPPCARAPGTKTFNAPIIYKAVPLSTFKRCRVTVTAPWATLYDQGGLILVLPAPAPADGEGLASSAKWVKTGIEFVDGTAWVSTVACDNWADWSLSPVGIVTLGEGKGERKGERKCVTLEMERRLRDETLWLYTVQRDGTRVPMREVTWALSQGEDQEAWIGAYAATPTVEGRGEDGGLKVEFKDWELDLLE